MSKKVAGRNFKAISRLKALVSVIETFNRTDAASLGKTDSGASWSNIRGSWGISSNKASSSTAASSYPLATLTFSKEEVTLTAKGVGPGVGTAFWITDSDNWWGTYVDTVQTCDTCSSGGNCSTYGTQCNANNATVYGVTSYTGGNCATYANQCTSNNATSAVYGCTSANATVYGVTGYTGGNCASYGLQGYTGGTCAGYGVTSYSGGNCASYTTVYAGGGCSAYGNVSYGPSCGVYANNAATTSCAVYGVTGSNASSCNSYGAGSCTTWGTKRYYAGNWGYFTNCNAYNYGCTAFSSGNTSYGCLGYTSSAGSQYCVVYFSSGYTGTACNAYAPTNSSTQCASANATSAVYGCTSANATSAVYGCASNNATSAVYGVTANSTCNTYGVTSYTGGNCATYGGYCASSNATSAVYGVTANPTCSTYGTVCNATNPVVYSACNCVNNDKVKVVKNVAGTITTVATLAFASTIAAIKTVLSGNSVTVSAYSDTSATTQIGSSQETTISGQTKSKVHGILKGVVTYSAATTSTIDQFEVN